MLSHRDGMIVARQFIAWNRGKNDPSRMGRCDPDVEFAKGHGVERHDCDVNHTVPYGTGPLCDVFQAINCLATITPSSTGQQTVGTCPHFQLHITPSFEDEDEDDDENDAPRTACRALGLAEAGLIRSITPRAAIT